MAILQLKIHLDDISPKIWRRFLVNDNIGFHKLHNIIQKIMGWENYHLYEFNVNNDKLGQIDDDALDANPNLKDSEKIKLSKYLNKNGQKFAYLYDFGDSWEHKLIIEKILESLPQNINQTPYCIEGERACPKEDCSGTGGYERFVEILKTGKDPFREDPKELKIWLDDWNPEKFNPDKINNQLKKL